MSNNTAQNNEFNKLKKIIEADSWPLLIRNKYEPTFTCVKTETDYIDAGIAYNYAIIKTESGVFYRFDYDEGLTEDLDTLSVAYSSTLVQVEPHEKTITVIEYREVK